MKTQLLKFFLLLFTMLSIGFAAAQEKNFYGKVVDQKTKEAIPGVYVVVNEIPVSYTNLNGIFELSCDATKIKKIVFQHLAYEPNSIELIRLKADTILIALREKNIELMEVSVSPERIKSILKRAHKQFVKTYRPNCYWAQSHYKQSLYYDGKALGYLECLGYTFMPITHPRVWPGEPLTVPTELRRTHENKEILIKEKVKAKNYFLQVGPDQFNLMHSEFSFFECLHPLAKYNFNNYEFRFDSIESENHHEYVLQYRQKRKVINVAGWPLIGSVGKIWIDRESMNISKIVGTFSRYPRTTQTEISYTSINGIVYPKEIRMRYLKVKEDSQKSLKKLFLEMELDFLKIDQTPRQNYQRFKHNVLYNAATIFNTYDYHPDFWKQYPTKGKLEKLINELSNSDPDKEFYLGAKEPVYDNKSFYYNENVNKIVIDSTMQFIQQMKKDLNLK